mmetsp:Transcript_27547/g.70317  ORF Transcript_27547/g.70317 Transcript_27547/m.70317 type:complete len:104 (+) Transcript_27547:1237-1548(+)
MLAFGGMLPSCAPFHGNQWAFTFAFAGFRCWEHPRPGVRAAVQMIPVAAANRRSLRRLFAPDQLPPPPRRRHPARCELVTERNVLAGRRSPYIRSCVVLVFPC